MNIAYLIESIQQKLPSDLPSRFTIDAGVIQRDIEWMASPIVKAETGLDVTWSCGVGGRHCAAIDKYPIIASLLVSRTVICLLLKLLDAAATTSNPIKSESLGDSAITSGDQEIVDSIVKALDQARIEYDSILKAFRKPIGLRYDTVVDATNEEY